LPFYLTSTDDQLIIFSCVMDGLGPLLVVNLVRVEEHHRTLGGYYQILQLVLYLHAQLHSPVLLGVV
jgi:hypothetical protein